jgi:hypothetical protein
MSDDDEEVLGKVAQRKRRLEQGRRARNVDTKLSRKDDDDDDDDDDEGEDSSSSAHSEEDDRQEEVVVVARPKRKTGASDKPPMEIRHVLSLAWNAGHERATLMHLSHDLVRSLILCYLNTRDLLSWRLVSLFCQVVSAMLVCPAAS